MVNRNVQLSFFFVAFGLLALLGFLIVQPYINILVLAGTFAIIFYPLYQKILKHWHGRFPSLASLVTVLIASLIIFIPLGFMGTRLFNEAVSVYDTLSDPAQSEVPPLGNEQASDNRFIANLQQRINAGITNAAANFDRYAQSVLGSILSNAGKLAQEVAYFGLALFLWFLSFYYFLRDGERLKKIAVAFSPLSDRYDLEIVRRVQTSVRSVIGGSLIVAVIQGVLAGVGLAIFGVPNPAIWGFVAVIAALVPTIGTALIMLPAVGYLFIINETMPAVGLLVWSLLVVGSIDNVIRPKLIERGIHIHPLTILLSVLGGIAFFGPVGFLTGPIIMSLLAEFIDIYQEMVLHKQPHHDADIGSA